MTGFLVIVFFYLTGEALVQLVGVPIPGSVAGLVLLVAALFVSGARAKIWQSTEDAARLLLHYFPLFLVPVVAGVIDLSAPIRESFLTLFLVSLAALLASLALTGLLAQLFFRRFPSVRE